MDPILQQESEKLARSWMRHEAAMLRDYLVADVEDPRINVQSILTRHFLVGQLFGDHYRELANAELHYGFVMNWLLGIAKKAAHPDILADIALALERGTDNADGFDLPHFIRTLYSSLPTSAHDRTIPNYLEEALKETAYRETEPVFPSKVLHTFQLLWNEALARQTPQPLTVLEPACGSANDFRFVHRYGIAQLLNYTGIDICEKNIANARELFPQTRFHVGNAFEIAAADSEFDCTYVHDLFEHLSPDGVDKAIREICRVTRKALCVHFFNLDEIPQDLIRPVEEYHWNTLAMEPMRARFAAQGFAGQVLNIAQFQRYHTHSTQTHNPRAYTFILQRVA